MAEIEILIVDDASTDNSLPIIEDLQKEDKRIRIIKNKENSGPLFSKSIGALEAKGKYIMQLDSDDLFINLLSPNANKKMLFAIKKIACLYHILYI